MSPLIAYTRYMSGPLSGWCWFLVPNLALRLPLCMQLLMISNDITLQKVCPMRQSEYFPRLTSTAVLKVSHWTSLFTVSGIEGTLKLSNSWPVILITGASGGGGVGVLKVEKWVGDLVSGENMLGDSMGLDEISFTLRLRLYSDL